MRTQKIISFTEALELVAGNRNLLLGNGFSIACKHDIFSYRALLEEANFESECPLGSKVFKAFHTADFEAAIQKLEDSAKVLKIYKHSDQKTPKQILADANCIRENLIKTLTAKHPVAPSNVTDEQFAACRKFLNHFASYYTLNYDLLLYWALLSTEVDSLKIQANDGFTRTDGTPDEYVVWDGTYKQNVFYLHGALHIFDAEYEIQKYTWANTGIKLIDQIRQALSKKMFPIFVAEGTSTDKMRKIFHNGYLEKCFRSFKSTSSDLFIFGLSLSKSDEHIIQAIERGKIKNIFISIHGDPTSPKNKVIFSRAAKMQLYRKNNGIPLTITYYNADSAKVWG